MAQNQQGGPDLHGLVSDPDFQKLNADQQRQAIFGVTQDKSFQSLTDAQLGEFVSKMRTPTQPVPAPTLNGSVQVVSPQGDIAGPEFYDKTQKLPSKMVYNRTGIPQLTNPTIGSTIPDWMIPGLSVANKVLNTLPEEGAKVGGEAATDIVGALSTHPIAVLTGMARMSMGLPPTEGEDETLQNAPLEFQFANPVMYGATKAVGEAAGGLVSDPKNWPFMFAGPGKEVINRLIAKGFSVQMISHALSTVPDIAKAIKNGDVSGASEAITNTLIGGGLGTLSAIHGFGKVPKQPITSQVPAYGVGSAEVNSSSRMSPEFAADELTHLRDRAKKIINDPKATPEERSIAQGLKQHVEERIASQPTPVKPPAVAPSEPHSAELRTNTEAQATPPAEPVNPLDKKIADVPQENLAPLRDELRKRAAELQAQATNIRDLDSQFSKNAANAQALIDMKKTGGPVRQLATPEGERITVKPDAELGVHARNVLSPLEGKEARFSDADLQSNKFDRTKPANVSDEDWNKALNLAKAKFFRDRNALIKDIDVANSTGHSIEETNIPERLKDLDQTGQLIWKLPAGETGNKAVTQAPAPEQILRTWDTKTQEAATGKNLKNFNNGKLLTSEQLEQIAREKEAQAQEHLALAQHIDQKLTATPKTPEYLYHATDVSRVPSIEEQGLRKGAWFAKSPEDALRSGAVPVSGNRADLRLFRVPANEVVPGTPDAADIGAREVEKGRFVQSQVPHPNAEQVDAKGLPVKERISANAKILQEAINPENLNTRADMTKAIDTASDLLVKDSNPRMLHEVADASTINVANALGMTPDDLFREEAHPQLTDAKVVAADLALKHNLDNVFNVAEQARTGAVPKEAFFEALAKHAALQEVVDKKIGKEAGRILRARQIVKDEALQEAALDRATSRPKAMRRAAFDMLMKLSDAKKQQAIEAFLKIPKDDTFATAKFIRDFARFQEASKLGRFQNVARELYLNSLLSGPVGLIKAASDSAMALMTPWLNGLRDVIETKKISALPKDVGIQYHALLSSFPQAVKAMAESWHTELGSSSEFEPREFAVGGTPGRIVRVPTRIAASVNDFFYTVQREMELRLLASRHAESLGLKGRSFSDHVNAIVSNPSPEFYRRATNTATINTFNNRIGGSIGSLIKTLREFPGGWWMMPIVKIPTNLAKFGIDLTPLGFAHAELIRRSEASGEGRFATSPISASTAQSRAIMGTAAMVWAYNMARQGKLSGNGPSDYKERERLEATGWQPNSIKVGNSWISYKKLEPIATPLMAAGTFHDAITYDKTKPDQSVLAHGLLNTLSNEFQTMPFLQSLSAVQTWIAGGPEAAHSLTQFAMQEVGSVIPTGVADMAHAIDATYRKPTTFGQELESRVPGLSQNVPAVTDVTGQPAQRPAGAVGGLNPFPVSPVIHNEVAGEIERLNRTKPQTGPTVTVPRNGLPRGIAAAKIQISPEEKIALDHQDAQISAARKKALMDSPIYKQMTDEQKREAFTRIDRMTKESRANRLQILRQGVGR